ncbi:cyclophilin-like fold protein [Coprobacillaceae bacterium CR2/5/TPMF4]|nr:cyclophilin-like fold protein [Coprobacillaceae bacterium CR2/5/TPMF4]
MFYPSKSLATKNTPLLSSGQEGTLGYFSPWKNVVMYYDRCGSYNGLYVLGEAIKEKKILKIYQVRSLLKRWKMKMSKILVVVGSGNVHGNTDQLSDAFIKGAKELVMMLLKLY